MLPAIEDANRLGFLVYPPLHDHESVQLQARGNGVLAITWFINGDRGLRSPAFVVQVRRSAGPGGLDDTQVTILDEHAGFDAATAVTLVAAVTSGINSPPGSVGLRGAHNFITPAGWDTVYTAVFNEPQRPAVSTLTTRVETDWFPCETEFRVILEKGDITSVIGSGPIGQVLFVPREDCLIAEATEVERQRFAAAHQDSLVHSVSAAKTTRYGGVFSDYYREQQHVHRNGAGDGQPLR